MKNVFRYPVTGKGECVDRKNQDTSREIPCRRKERLYSSRSLLPLSIRGHISLPDDMLQGP